MKREQPLFLIPPGDEIVRNWKPAFQQLEQSDNLIVFTVNPTIIREGQVGFIQQMVMALQHHPRLIERMVFSVTFKFMLVDDVAVEVSEEEWKMKPEVYAWFHAMSSLPIMIYFLSDGDARGYCLLGDILASGGFNYKQDTRKHILIEFTEEQRQLIVERLFHSAWSMLMYCHATGFNPDKYIDALLADYDMPFTSAEVRKQYEEDIERGMQFRMMPEA